jgi:hypothetical protein
MAPHEQGPSHLEIDLDLARAYDTSTSPDKIEEMVLSTISLFARAADEVADEFLPVLLAA